jgi:hypothetical protein
VANTIVLIVGLEPSLIDFSEPAYGASGLGAASVRAGLEADEAHLNALGYDAELCLTDFGETAETVLRERLKKKACDCILVGAGLRLIAQNTPLFNTKPADIAEAVQRCLPAEKQT